MAERHTNPYEAQARAEKAFRIAKFLAKHSIGESLAATQTDEEWAQTAALAGCKSAPSPTTRGMVLDHLRQFAIQ